MKVPWMIWTHEVLNTSTTGALTFGLFEDRGFLELHAHPQAQQHHDHGGDERDAPAPDQERVVTHGVMPGGAELHDDGQDQEEAVGQDEAERRTQLGPHGGTGTLALFRVLGGQQRRAGPLAAQAQALTETQDRQDQGSPDADGVVGG